jgi:fatty acid desaturase
MDQNLGDWYACKVDRGELKALMRRSDARGLAQFGGFLALVAASGVLAYQSLGSAWLIPAFLFYGTLFAFAEAASHELDHGTPFRTRWLNDAGAWIACFMMWREPVFGRYKHARHHSFTSIIGSDPEGAGFRSRNLFDQGLEMLIRHRHARLHMGATIRHAFGIVSERDRNFFGIPESEDRRMFSFLYRGHRLVGGGAKLASGGVPLVAPFIWSVAARPLFEGPARRARDQHQGPSGDDADHAARSGPALSVLEHELPYRTSPPSQRPVPRPAQAARENQGPDAAAFPGPGRHLGGNSAGPDAAAERP